MSTHTDVAHLIAPAIKPIPINGLVVGYARSAGGGDVATAHQRMLLEEYAGRMFGRPLDAFYEDVKSSGIRMDRPGLGALKRDALNGQIAVIVVVDIERIARGLRLATDFEAYCEQTMVKLHTCMEGPREYAPVLCGDFPAEYRKKLMGTRIAAGKAHAKAMRAAAG